MEYTVIRSSRKTIAIQIDPQGKVTVRCPNRMPARDIENFVASKREWIEKHLAQMKRSPSLPSITEDELHQLAGKMIPLLKVKLPHYAALLGVSFGRVTVRNQRSKWGSCSSKGNLNFNCLLMLAPSEVLDYVIVHELCHRLEMNHSPAFWANVERLIPDYKMHRQWLKDHGGELLGRLPDA